MKRRLLTILILVSVLALSAWWWNDRLGELSLGNRGIARKHGTARFEPERWQKADKVERGKVAKQVFVREHDTMIAAPVQGYVDGIPRWSHYVSIPIATGRPNDSR
jgi:hypothetical protein